MMALSLTSSSTHVGDVQGLGLDNDLSAGGECGLARDRERREVLRVLKRALPVGVT
jgi:hypothetical protein